MAYPFHDFREYLAALEAQGLLVRVGRPINKDTGTVRAEGRIIHRGRTVATAEGTVKDAAGKLYAHATTTCLVFPAKG